LVFDPVSSFRRELDIELEENLGQNQPHLGVRQIPSDAVPWTDAKRLHGAEVVLGEFGVPEESLWPEFFWLGEVRLAVVGGQLPDRYGGLLRNQSAPYASNPHIFQAINSL